MRFLFVGDPHVTVEELPDCQNLLNLVFDTYEKENPDKVIFLGDLHHNHALVRVEVTDFWIKNLSRFNKDKVVLLVGNHDRPNDSSATAHALQAYRGLGKVVERLEILYEHIAVAPYYPSNYRLIEDVALLKKTNKIDTLICHQTFDGSKFESGFFAPEGLDPVLLGIDLVISGHIHTRQTLNWCSGDIEYIGSPRWRTIADSNEIKGLCIYDTVMNDFDFIDTSTACSPIGRGSVTDVSQLDSIPYVNNPKARLHIDVPGPKAEVEIQTALIKAKLPKAKIRPVYTDETKKASVTESEGIHNALRRYIASCAPAYGTEPDIIQEMITRRLNVNAKS